MYHEHYLCTDAVADMVLWLQKTLALVLLAAVLSCPQVVQILKEEDAPSTDQEEVGRKSLKTLLCMRRMVRRTAKHIPIGSSSVLFFNTHYCITFQSPALTTVRLLVVGEVF